LERGNSITGHHRSTGEVEKLKRETGGLKQRGNYRIAMNGKISFDEPTNGWFRA